MRKILTSLMLIASAYSFAQVGISAQNTDTPQATLDVSSIDGKTNGILIPRVSRVDADGMAKPPKKTGAGKAESIVESTLIYINDVSGAAPTNYATNVDAKGFYYFKDGKWVKLGGKASAEKTWRDFRTAESTTDVSGLAPDIDPLTVSNGGVFKVSENRQDIPATAFLVIHNIEGVTSIKLPEPTTSMAGKMIVVTKTNSGTLSVQDHNGKQGHASGSKLLTDGSLYPYTGKIFISDGEYWYSLNQ